MASLKTSHSLLSMMEKEALTMEGAGTSLKTSLGDGDSTRRGVADQGASLLEECRASAKPSSTDLTRL
jgi:hypothetical protein